ncbi:MAG TPA: PGF-CTERM sorting domain-containing protein [Methanothrix sp.]|nr:PGF-CTERM sorting domain-containing protein [Methanothrix sp.]HPT18592.1 PGF-CTERM sorting domain-containing protein [Methanothrix sp.]
MKLNTIILMGLITLFVAAVTVNAEDTAKAEMEKGSAAVENAAGEAKQTVVVAAENASARAEEVVENVAAKAEELKEGATAKADEAAESATAKAEEVEEKAKESAEKSTPGFECLFSLTGLLGAAWLLTRRE